MSSVNKNVRNDASGIGSMSSRKPVHVIAVTAGKGGVGKSSISINLAIGLAKKGKRVLLLDADLGLANIDIMLGLNAKKNLSHVMDSKCNLNDIIISGPEGIQIVPSSSGNEHMAQLSSIQQAGIIDAFNEITDELDYMIVDTAAGISQTVLSFTRSAQELIVVICDEPTSIADAYALIKILSKRYGLQNFHILANMVRSPKDGRAISNKLLRMTDQFLDVNISYMGEIPFDENMCNSVKKQQSILASYPESPASKTLLQLSEDIIKWSFSDALPGSTSFFIERFISEMKSLQ